MAEEREKMDRQIPVGRHNSLNELRTLRYSERVFILLHGKAKPVAIVVKENSYDGKSAQCGTFSTSEHILELRIRSYELRVVLFLNYELRVTNYELRITSYSIYELRITSYELRVFLFMNYGFGIVNYEILNS